MNMTRYLLNLPVPAAAPVLAMPQIPDGPDWAVWAMGVSVGAWAVVQIADLMGWLPTSGDRRTNTFTAEDRQRLAEIYRNVTREDPDKPGWPMVWTAASESREARAMLERLAKLIEQGHKLTEDQANQVKVNIETLRAIQRGLGEMQQGLTAMDGKMDTLIGLLRKAS